ncbi:MAG: sugar ABC transporter ATP-binding protein [Planctomycetia bacterium]|nr:sugar ABC transporter ATP-binding protein [Planctomycetia bacterium]
MSIAAEIIPLLQCRGISKRFGGETALDNVDFELRAGEVHGLVGSNGAGKSTLMKILAGVLPDHEGQVLLEGRPANLASPQDALAQGIAMVYQELSGIGQLSVAENLFLGRQPTQLGRIDWGRMRRKAREYLGELQIDVDVTRRLDTYPLVIRQMVEIARGLHSGARILILDEPTSALSPPETRRLFQLIDHLRSRQVAIVYISHFIEDVLEICDRVTILRDGRRLETSPVKKLTKQSVIHAMLGQALSEEEMGYTKGATLPPRTAVPPRLVARGLTVPGVMADVNLEVSPGECLGLYGFVGAGHQEAAHVLAGAMRASAGIVEVDGTPLPPGSTSAAVRRGVVLVAADRQHSVFHRAPIFQNVTLAHLRSAVGQWLTRRREMRVTQPVLVQVGCRPAAPALLAGNLSGGNQQKVALAKWLLGEVKVLVLDEPTRGMDVGAKHEIMQLVARLKQQGAAVVLASVEPELLLAYADRIAVMSRGRITREFCGCAVDKATLMRQA